MSAEKKLRTEHAGAKNGGGYHGTRAEAKAVSRVLRRGRDRAAVAHGLSDVTANRCDDGTCDMCNPPPRREP